MVPWASYYIAVPSAAGTMRKSSCRSRLLQLEEEERNTTPFQDAPHFLHIAHPRLAAATGVATGVGGTVVAIARCLDACWNTKCTQCVPRELQ